MQKLNKFLIKTLQLKPEETTKFLLLFFHSFFVGLFIAFYFVQANSVFIKNYGSEQLPIAYMVAGLFGYISTFIYSALQKKVKVKYLFIGALMFMFIITMIGRLCFGLVDEKYLSFFVFIWAWPFISLAGIEAGGLSLRLLNLIQMKRMFGYIGMGGVSASIFGYLIIPILTRSIGTSYNLLFFAAFSLLAAVVLLFVIYNKFPEENQKTKETHVVETDSGFRHLIKEKYFLLIFLSATLSTTVIYIADFGFLSTIKMQTELFSKEGSIPAFLALVYGGLKIGELIISYSSSRILSKYGVKLGLTIMPITLAFIVLISAIVGFSYGVVGVLFLVLMTLNKSMERILRRGLDDPAFNILYQPLPTSKQMTVQTKVGIVMQLGIGIAGIILFLLNALLKVRGGFDLQYFPLFFLPILIAWVFVALKLYAAYKQKIRDVLVELNKKQPRESTKYQYGTEVLTKKFKKFNANVVNLAVTILSETNPRILEPYASSLLQEDDPVIKKAILRNIDPTWRERAIKQIEKIAETADNKEVKRLAIQAVEHLDFSQVNVNDKDIPNLLKSDNHSDKLLLIKHLIKNNVNNSDKIILELLNCNDKIIKSAAIRIAVKIKSDDVLKRVVYLLESAEYYHICTATIIDIGEKSLPFLDQLFKETESKETILKIVEIYAKMGSKPARSLLIRQINYPDRKIQLGVIWALYFCKFQAIDEEEIDIVRKKIEQATSNLLWIMSAIRDIEEEKSTLKLFLALDQEKVDSFELMFNLLSFLHDPRVINLIKKNIIGKNTIYALELIDNFVMPVLKPIIVPIFDDISVSQKIKKLSKYFPQKKMSFNERLNSIVMLNFDQISTWTVAKAIEMMDRLHKKKQVSNLETDQKRIFEDIKIWNTENINQILHQIKRSELPDEVFLCLFHCEELVYSTAAKIIYDENPVKCIEYLSNMSADKQKLKDDIIKGGHLLADKVKLLRRFQLFFSIPDYLLVKIAQLIEFKTLEKGQKVYFEYKGSNDIIILLKGGLIYNEGLEDEYIFSKKIIITRGLNIDSGAEYLTGMKGTEVLILNRYKYFNLLIDETEILQQIFEIIQD